MLGPHDHWQNIKLYGCIGIDYQYIGAFSRIMEGHLAQLRDLTQRFPNSRRHAISLRRDRWHFTIL